ncbi:hypothetical protein EU519_00315 [Candidatus Thorarchaeota archaeon]|nr:MAG: hypothetical protein EU519_00315 [Candidatus Thorarchaeota archaeon]
MRLEHEYGGRSNASPTGLIAMTERYVKLVICSPRRCTGCTHSLDERCTLLDSISLAADQATPVLVEKDRNLLHIPIRNTVGPLRPPWMSMDWEQVWMDDDFKKDCKLSEIIDLYAVGPYVSVFAQVGENKEISHTVLPRLRSRLEFALLEEMTERARELTERVSVSFNVLTERIGYIQTKLGEEMDKSWPEISLSIRDIISQIAGFSSTMLFPITPLLLDDEIEEIYVDGPDSWAYFDHARLGRCRTDWFFSGEAIEPMVTLARLESNHHLDRRNPSLKSRIGFLGVDLRISMAVEPLCPDGFQMQIRRARKEIMTLSHLIRNDTISVEGAALLILALYLRQNMVITGAPGTGKTTLLNAMDQITPPFWRKIYIEDAIESRIHRNQHQSRIQVDPIDERNGLSDKSQEIVKSLHRSPDYVILGEIQTQEHSHALFHALSAGLRCLSTCHSNSAASLISRFQVNHHIDKASLALLDLIVTMRRPVPGSSRRYVSEIVEVRRDTEDGCLKFRGLNLLYSNDSHTGILDNMVDDGAFSLRMNEGGVAEFDSLFADLIARLKGLRETSSGNTNDDLQKQAISLLRASTVT